MKIGIIIKSAAHARLGDGDAFADHIARHSQALFGDKLEEGQACS